MAVLNSTLVNGNLNVTGTVSASGYTTTSDKRLKENIKEFKPEATILNLPIYIYDYKEGLKAQVGCLAQDLQELFPELVVENENGFLSIQESKLVYPLLLELKRQQEEIEALKTEISSLKSQI